MQPTTNTHKVLISLGALVLFLVVVSFLLYRNTTTYKLNHINNTVENVVTTPIDLTTAKGVDRIPVAFPQNLPIETATITESYSSNYIDQGLTLSGVTYTTTKTENGVLLEYARYMIDGMYSFTPTILTIKENKEVLPLRGLKDANELNVFTSSAAGITTVKLVYTAKK